MAQKPSSCCVRKIGNVRFPLRGRPKPILPRFPSLQGPAPTRPFPPRRPAF